MVITSKVEALQAIEDIRGGMYGAKGSVEREAIINSIREYESSLVQPPPPQVNGDDDAKKPINTAAKEEVAKWGRGAALAGRTVTQGVAGLAGIASDPVAYLMNKGLEAAGVDPRYRFPGFRAGISEQLTAMGVPEAETESERMVEAVGEGVTGGMLTMGLAGASTSLATKAPGLFNALTSWYEPVAAGGAGLGLGYAREKEWGPAGQMGAMVAGTILAPTGVASAKGTAGLIARGVDQFTAPGRARIVGKELTEIAHDPVVAAKALEEAPEIVPGSVPTMGVASGDMGLLGMEAGKRSVHPQIFGVRLSQQNSARRALLQDIIEGDPTAMRAARDLEMKAAREAALAGEPLADVAPVIAHIDNILASPVGVRSAVKGALPWIKKELQAIKTDVRRLYELRKDISDVIKGKGGEGTKGWEVADKQLIEIRNTLDDVIEEVAPGFKKYIEEYARLSKLADQAERLTEIGQKGVVAAIDPISGQRMLSQSKFQTLLTGEKAKTGFRKILTDDQLNVIDKISKDLDRAMTITSPHVKGPGSNTVANLVGEAFKGGLGQSTKIRMWLKPLSWLGELTVARQRDLMIEAMLDPKLAAQLMRGATRIDIERMSISLAEKAAALGYGGTVGAGEIIETEEPVGMAQGGQVKKTASR